MSASPDSSKRVRGAQRTEREDWVDAAVELLVSDGIEAVKPTSLATKLNCARSSFYWYFNDLQSLLDAVLNRWQTRNTEAITSRANSKADSINFALTKIFSAWALDLDTKSLPFDSKLDFAVRDWGRKDPSVQRIVNFSDDTRINAIRDTFERFGYEADEARIRARIVYFTQIGYEALDERENRLDRAVSGPHYLFCMTGKKPTADEISNIQSLAARSPR